MNKLILGGLLLSAVEAWGGVGSSGGGFAVVCRDTQKQIQSAEVLDLYEARTVFGFQLVSSQGDLKKDYLQVVSLYRKTGMYPAPIDDTVFEHYKNLEKALVLVPDATALGTTNDRGRSPAVPAGCAIEQLAVYKDGQHKFLVNREIWQHLNSLNQAALFHHEVIYYGYRQMNDKTSENTRNVVAKFFSKDPLPRFTDYANPSDDEYSGGLEIVESGIDQQGHRWASRSNTGPRTTTFFYSPHTPQSEGKIIFTKILGLDTFYPAIFRFPFEMNKRDFRIIDHGPEELVMSVLQVRSSRINFEKTFELPLGVWAGYKIQMIARTDEIFRLKIWDTQGKLVDEILMEP